MRMWYGVDVEHNPSYGKLTLFVESSNPDVNIVFDILTIIPDNIECIYFGAGEVDILNWSFLDNLDIFPDIFMLGVESSVEVPKCAVDRFDFIILRTHIPYKSNKINFKYRTDDEVGLINLDKFNTTLLDTLSDGQYAGDVEVYRKDD